MKSVERTPLKMIWFKNLRTKKRNWRGGSYKMGKNRWRCFSNRNFFYKIPASKILVTCNLDPVELFDQMFDDTFFLTLSTETNRYYRETLKNKKQYSINWKDVTIDEMKSFMGIILLLQVNQKKSLHEHWDKNLLIASPVSSLLS